MSWSPNDLVTDADLRDYEESILTTFGKTTWQTKRQKALDDWLFPVLKTHGFDPYRLRTRYEPSSVLGLTSGVYTDVTGAAKDSTEDDIDLAALLVSSGNDALYVGSDQPFIGVFVRMAEAISTAVGYVSVWYFNGNWEKLIVADTTEQVSGRTFSAGGTVTWLLPVDWMVRTINSVSGLYWVKLQVSNTPTGARVGQVSTIRSSVLRAPVTYRTLELIFREAPTGGDGPWRDKADYYATQATDALEKALQICGGEFDTDESDVIGPTEEEQTPAEVSSGWHLERA